MTALLHRWLDVLRCPQCHENLDLTLHNRITALRCVACRSEYTLKNGIPRLLVPARLATVQAFCAKYEALRRQEGWASDAPEFYLHLPFRDLSGRHPQEWKLRSRSFQFLKNWLENNFARKAIRILDVGAGSGWMSRQLAERHEVLALDVNAGPHGLAALPMTQRPFMAVQAELEDLPLASNSFDVAIANASLHYAQNFHSFFAKISRVLRPGGTYTHAGLLRANGLSGIGAELCRFAQGNFFKATGLSIPALAARFFNLVVTAKSLARKIGETGGGAISILGWQPPAVCG